MVRIEKILMKSLEKRLELWSNVEEALTVLIRDISSDLPESVYQNGYIHLNSNTIEYEATINVISKLIDLRDRSLRNIRKNLEYPEEYEILKYKTRKEVEEELKKEKGDP